MLNQATIEGRMAADCKNTTLPNGKNVTNFCVAVTRNYKDANGQYGTDFIDCVAFDKQGEFINRYFKKGSEIIVTGELQVRTYKDKNDSTHKVTAINVNKVFFTGSKQSNSTQNTDNQPNVENEDPGEPEEIVDTPFST